LTPEKAEKMIIETVEPLYFDATLDDLDANVRVKKPTPWNKYISVDNL